MALDGAENQPDELGALTELVSEFIDKARSIENEIDTLKADQKELIEEYKDKLDMKTLQAAMRTIKIIKKVGARDTYDTFVEICAAKENV